MGKRLTVIKMLRKRAAESEQMLQYHPTSIDMINVMGGTRDEERESQFVTNMKNDIEQIEFMIWAWNNKKIILNNINKNSEHEREQTNTN
jgi:hypothetical protein